MSFLRVSLVLVLLATTVPGCYEPQLADCTVSCGATGDCADGQVCGSDGFCAAPAIAGMCMERQGGGVGAVDSMQVDSPSACALMCPGSCDGATCVLDCTATGSCQGDVVCPANLPCRIACGDGACERVRCELASTCAVTCSGKNSCPERIACGAGRCVVACTGDRACRHGVECHDACACDVKCTGAMSCRSAASCPSNACAVGAGCVDTGGCNTCG